MTMVTTAHAVPGGGDGSDGTPSVTAKTGGGSDGKSSTKAETTAPGQAQDGKTLPQAAAAVGQVCAADISTLIRRDNNFLSERSRRGQRKSHLNERGDLVPANPAGSATVLDHVMGLDPAKSDSPFTSLSTEGAAAGTYGASLIRVDLARLRADIAAGRLDGVAILCPEDVQGEIQANADTVAGAPVNLTIPPGTTKPEAEKLARALDLSESKVKRVAQRMIDMMNARRDQEWLIKGTVPATYIEGPL